jgi:hypothetical protein
MSTFGGKNLVCRKNWSPLVLYLSEWDGWAIPTVVRSVVVPSWVEAHGLHGCKAMARGRVCEGNVPPPTRSAKPGKFVIREYSSTSYVGMAQPSR